MNHHPHIQTRLSACPHDCPSTCALEVEVLDGNRIGKVRGARGNSYTAGVICAKVARYAERIHHPDRLLKPRQRVGEKGGGEWRNIAWDDALDLVAEKFVSAEQTHGSESVWPFFDAGTMGLVQRDGINRLRHAKRYSGGFATICVNMAWAGFFAGTGALRGPDPREMAQSDCVVIWGTNAVSTQVNVMTHAMRARKTRGARIVVIDVYRNETMRQADMGLCLRPGTDAALACATMHVLFRDGLADRAYLARYTDDPVGLEAHLRDRTPQWAASITGLTVEEIEAFARLIGTTPRSYFRLGYGFTRQRNGTAAMHAALSIPCVTGAWQHEGGGGFHSNAGIFGLDKQTIEGAAFLDPSIRHLDQSRIGAVLNGEKDDLGGGPPVTAMLTQNTNPANVSPEQRKVVAGLSRPDLFLAVHEQFMTDTAGLADIVLPATMFMEHDDIYRGGGQQHIVLGPKLIEPPEDVRTNHFVVEELARRLGVDHMPGFRMTERELIADMLEKSGRGTLCHLEKEGWLDCQPDFTHSHYLDGFAYPDGRFRFSPDWTDLAAPTRPPDSLGPQGPAASMPQFPDHWEVTEKADADHPFRLVTAPSRSFLNSSFSETKTSREREGRPELIIHPDDAAAHGVADGDRVEIGNGRGEIVLHARLSGTARPGVIVTEGLWPNTAFERGEGINVLTGADPVAPHGGAAFHDNRVWIRPAP